MTPEQCAMVWEATGTPMLYIAEQYLKEKADAARYKRVFESIRKNCYPKRLRGGWGMDTLTDDERMLFNVWAGAGEALDPDRDFGFTIKSIEEIRKL